jgi:single-strand DNA-binding protein
MELTGRIKVIKDEQTFASGFTKREFVVTTEEQYPQDISFELLKEKGELITKYNTGDRIKVSFDIRGREWQGKYFNSLVAWKLETAGAESSGSTPPPPPPPMTESFATQMDDDLPF